MSASTFVAMSYNLWGNHRLDGRTPAIRALLETRPPDILAVQELCPASRDLIDLAMPGHSRVEDAFPGWSVQGNIWWDRELFQAREHGAEDIGIRAESARLFWVRLAPLTSPSGPALLVGTAHYTWPGHPQERADDVNPRVAQARRTVAAFDRLAGAGPCLFAADVNDYARPLWALREGGFTDCFAALGRTSPVTHPVTPSGEPGQNAPPAVPKAIDWLFHRGPLTPRSGEVVEFFHEGVAPSDHRPVVATYTLRGRAGRTREQDHD